MNRAMPEGPARPATTAGGVVTWTSPADQRPCDQCGAAFVPRREHGRFCSADCRARWNREQLSGPVAGVRTLDWAVYSMREAIARLYSVRRRDPAGVFAVVSEAVWRVTIVDAALVRYLPDAYDQTLDGLGADCRQVAEETLAGLRFVRNQMSVFANPADFVRPGPPPGAAAGAESTGIAGWLWNTVPAPATASLPPHGQAWEHARYRAYTDQLAGQQVGEVFERAVEFLDQALPPPEADAEEVPAARP